MGKEPGVSGDHESQMKYARARAKQLLHSKPKVVGNNKYTKGQDLSARFLSEYFYKYNLHPGANMMISEMVMRPFIMSDSLIDGWN
ncbi:MAG: hypothetical protein ACXWJZ_08150 [Burkholderiaceae bacterium]